MTLPPSPFEPNRRARGLKMAVAVWLLLVSVIAIVNSVGLSRLTEQTRRHEQDTQLKMLGARVADLVRQADTDRHQPKPVSQADFLAARQALEKRLAYLEQAQADAVQAPELQALQARVAAVEERQQSTQLAVAPTPQRRVAVAKPKTPAPPFRVMGVELRGGERFLSIAPLAASALANIRLLREGESDSGWQLQSIEAHTALFQVRGQTQRVALP